ncbi:MAG TPA: PspC domain-containing protein [Chitinophagales bacterium]|jgi:phage shock protein PspC (stress-responsive transcriptional regulator)|nr:PspC domain-containing protein [Chitinophagales bacterium]MBP6153728.1 PspC domain-containing protein [Chitinophagales bacterium]HQV77850.1 PspC domain-containing protein [Chitinophagales bacterium]HQW78571.1 PspC domain-containing protein [Chitinophagales bacterium]HRB66942.1 PspC domain-containing protein [Chitinophagales bacterium]
MLERPAKILKYRSLRDVIEMNVYGVCAFLGRKLSIPSKKVRLFFIYTSFIALGSPIIIYLILTFILNMRYMIKNKRNPVWDI